MTTTRFRKRWFLPHTVRPTEWWEEPLMAAVPPQRLPTPDERERFQFLVRQNHWFQPWQSNESLALARAFSSSKRTTRHAPPANGTLRSAKVRPFELRGKRLKIDNPQRRALAWVLQEAGSIDPRPCGFSLPASAMDKVLSANGLPIRSQNDEHRLINELCWQVTEANVTPPKDGTAAHAKALDAALQRFMQLLFDPKTDSIWAPEPKTRLAYLRRELRDFQERVTRWLDYRTWLRERACQCHKDATEKFIQRELWPAFAEIYGMQHHKPSATRELRVFARAFFDAIGFRRPGARDTQRPFPSDATIQAAFKPKQVQEGSSDNSDDEPCWPCLSPDTDKRQ